MAFFDHFFGGSTTRLGRWFSAASGRGFVRQIGKFVQPGARILEIGPGRGHAAAACVRMGYEYLGIEGNAAACDELRARRLNVIHAIVPPFPFSDEQFDCICAVHVLEHMPSPGVADEFVAGAIAHLAPGGIMAICSPELRSWGINFWRGDHTHTFPTWAYQTMSMFHDHGLVPEYCTSVSGPFAGVARYPFLIANKLNPWNVVESLFGPTLPPRRLRKLKTTFLECFVVVGKKPTSGPGVAAEQSQAPQGIPAADA